MPLVTMTTDSMRGYYMHSVCLYLIGCSKLGKLLLSAWVIWVGVRVVLLCQLNREAYIGKVYVLLFKYVRHVRQNVSESYISCTHT